MKEHKTTLRCPGRFFRSGSYSETDSAVTCSACEQRVRVDSQGELMPAHWLLVTIHSLLPQAPEIHSKR
jgi:hypothetical protein